MTQQDTSVVTELADALGEWLPQQRWFAGKDRELRSVTPLRTTVLGGGDDSELLHAVVAVDQGGPAPELYQLLLGLRRELPEHLGHSWVAGGGASADARAVYDATHDPDLTALLLQLIDEGREVGGVRFTAEPGVELDAGLRSRQISSEQSHTSLVYGQSVILKLFRRLVMGTSPDLELHRALSEVGCEHIAAPLGAIETDLDGEPMTLGMLTSFLSNTADGWAMATASVRDLLAESTAGFEGGTAHPDEVGGDFASEARRLGHAVAAVHIDLARALGRSEADVGRRDEVAVAMNARLDTVLAAVPELAGYETALRAAFDDVRSVTGPVPVQRIHGDLHLGQVLRSVTRWVLIDFEGEPSTSLEQRLRPASPLRDVGGMLRSFDYAAHHMLVGEADPAQHADMALEWAGRNRDAFCDGYAEIADDPREQAVLLRAFELDKAVYEVAYEHSNRPAWLPIPLASIARITASARKR